MSSKRAKLHEIAVIWSTIGKIANIDTVKRQPRWRQIKKYEDARMVKKHKGVNQDAK